jgi:dienelactone hydrolase
MKITALLEKTLVWVIFSVTLLSSCASSGPNDFTIKTYTYLTGQYPLSLDAYLPETSVWGDKRPAFILIHGGGWTSGTRDEFKLFANSLASLGIVAVCIDYHFAPVPVTADNPRINDGRFPWPEQLNNAQAAVWWMRNHAEELKIDPNKIAAFGGSAGGHIASMLSLNAGYQPGTGVSSEVQALVTLWAPSDLLADHTTSSVVNESPLVTQIAYDPDNYQILQKNPQLLISPPLINDAIGMISNLLGTSVNYKVPSSAARELASPLYQIPYHTPIPTLMIHGTADKLIPAFQSIEACTLKNKMVENETQQNSHNAVCKLVLLNGEGHRLPSHLSDPLDPNSRPNKDILIDEFLSFAATWAQSSL